MAQQMIETGETDTLIEKRLIRQLALEWVQSRLSSDEMTFVDCLTILANLQKATRNVDQTTAIFEIVFHQACRLKKSSEWLSAEIQFEILALSVPSRTVLLFLYLYNERLARFNDASVQR